MRIWLAAHHLLQLSQLTMTRMERNGQCIARGSFLRCRRHLAQIFFPRNCYVEFFPTCQVRVVKFLLLPSSSFTSSTSPCRHQLWVREISVTCRTSIASLCDECSVPDLCRNSARSERMSEGMSESMSEYMSERMSKDMSERMSEDMSERMSEDMSEDMLDRGSIEAVEEIRCMMFDSPPSSFQL